MGKMDELIQEYDALCGRNPPMEEIVAFLRERCPNGVVFRHLMHSPARNNILLTPAFLLALRDGDCLWRILANWLTSAHSHTSILLACIGRILGMREAIPDRIRAFLWNALMSRGRHLKLEIECWPPEDYAQNVVDYRSCRRINGGLLPKGVLFRVLHAPVLTEKMQAALEQDSVPLFEIELTMTGKRLGGGLLVEIVRHGAASLLSHLLRKRSKALAAILPPTDLLFYICARAPEGNDKTLAPILDTLEELYPGICQKAVDTLGNTPLWYCLYEQHNIMMEEALIRHGCDPDARNHLDLSYNLCKNWDRDMKPK